MKSSVETTVHAPLEEVGQAYVTPDDIMQWNTASDDWHTTSSRVDLRPGGEFSSRMEAKDGSAGFDFEGTYTRIITNRLIEYSLGERQVAVHFAEVPGGIQVRVVFDGEPSHSTDQQREGWQDIHVRLARHVTA